MISSSLESPPIISQEFVVLPELSLLNHCDMSHVNISLIISSSIIFLLVGSRDDPVIKSPELVSLGHLPIDEKPILASQLINNLVVAMSCLVSSLWLVEANESRPSNHGIRWS